MTNVREPMRSLRVRAGLAARIVRDRRTLHVPPGHPCSPIPSPEDVPLATFEALGPDDILFVDGSHVLNAGSDVQQLVDEVYPRLEPGVLLHVHDVFVAPGAGRPPGTTP